MRTCIEIGRGSGYQCCPVDISEKGLPANADEHAVLIQPRPGFWLRAGRGLLSSRQPPPLPLMESSLYVERAAGLGWRRHPRYRVREGPAQREGDPQDRSCCRRRARLHLRNSRKDGEDQKHELSPATESHLRSEKCHWRPISLRWSPTCDYPSIDVWFEQKVPVCLQNKCPASAGNGKNLSPLR